MIISNSDVRPGTDLAYYFSDWIWAEGRSTDFMKSMLIFFDGIALSSTGTSITSD